MLPRYLKKFDWILFGSCFLLSVFGLAVLYSTSLGGAEGAGDFGNFRKQVIFLGAGVLVALLFPLFNYRSLAAFSWVLYAVSAALLVAVLLFGHTVRGTTGWFGIGGLGIQPVELVKLFLIIWLARYFSVYARDPSGLKPLIGSGFGLAGIFLLVMLQPDLGSAFLLLVTWGFMLIASGIKKKHLMIMGAIALALAVCGWFFLLKPYQRDRIAVFMNPERDPLGKGYNVTQSVIAIGSGGVTGKGLGFGSQSQLRFLPERQTDFIFAVLAEELGFIGVILVSVLFAAFFCRGYLLAASSRDDFTLFLVLGIVISIAAEIFVNIGGNLRLLPVTGITLPFVSYGGSSLLVKYLMVGVLGSIAVRRQ